MSSRPPGRRIESLFDNRYRYDTIYPRGRSGETLRAYDMLDHERPVVIKRPASQDAPPMRAGQEVSIRNEKQALERLAGHPVLTELRGSGTFRVGGHTHDYIVMDLATGQIVEEMVLESAQVGEVLPELESLVIIDRLLDLLAYAHDKQVLYNDVDAKHLFWNREIYQLKVIDWGNAVFTDEPGALPSVSRATDIYQCGELLYFILTGGSRIVTQIEEGETFFVNFGSNAERIPAKLQAIVTRTVHPDPKRRYGSINELRQALAEYRLPLEKTRDDIIARVKKRVRPTASQEELEELSGGLRVALDMDPGYPDAVGLAAMIQSHLRQILMQADLDAIRIYLESANWPRALALLHDLLPTADEVSEPLIHFLIAATTTLENMQIAPPPDGFMDALDPLLRGDAPAAGQILLTTPDNRPEALHAQWLLAEQLATLVSDVALLRPHLVRLQHELRDVPGANSALSLLDQIDACLEEVPLFGLTGIQVMYEQAAELLAQLEEVVEALADNRAVHDQEALLASVIRARRAANELLDQLTEIGQVVFGDPSHAGDLLHRATMIDPTSPYFAGLHDYFDEVHQAIIALGQFKPKSDGTNLAAWFADVQEFLQPYLDDLPDKQLHAAAAAVRRTGGGWTKVMNYMALGRRQPTIEALRETAEDVRPINEQIAAWLGTVANRLPDATYIERHSPNSRLADALIEGWKAWDRGEGLRAAEWGKKAYECAATDGERLAADRLRRLGELLNQWLAEDGPTSIEQTDQAETEAVGILLSEEEHERRIFAEQMPNTTLYLRAMSRGIVAYMQQSSSAGWRALYMHYVLRGMLSILNDDLEEAEFWRNAASKTYEDARIHRVFQVLDRALTGRILVMEAEKALNAVDGLEDLDNVRHALNAPLAGELLVGAEQALQSLNEALRDWSDGDFHGAVQGLDAALRNIQTAIDTAGLKIDPFVVWLTELRDTAAELQQARLFIEQASLSSSQEPDPHVADAHRRIVKITLETLGSDYAHQMRQWEEMYRAVLDTYTTQRLDRREKLAAFGRHFASLFITKHPAYPLFRYWESVIHDLPADEPEETVTVLPVVTRAASVAENEVAYLEDDQEPQPDVRPASDDETELPWNRIIIGAAVVLIVVIVLAVWRYSNRDDTDPAGQLSGDEPTQALVPAGLLVSPSTTRTPTVDVSPSSLPTTADAVLPLVTEEASPLATDTPSSGPTEITATDLPAVSPTEAEAPTVTLTPTLFVTNTLEPVLTPESIVPPAGPDRNVLAALNSLPAESRTWPAEAFVPGEDSQWRLFPANGTDNVIVVEFPPDMLSALFQSGAANTLTQADVIFELVEFDQETLAAGDVSFGLGAENIDGQRTIGQVQFAEENLVNLGLNQNNQFRARTQAPQLNPQIELSVRRVDATTFGFFVDGRHLGDSVALFSQGEPVKLILYASGRGTVVEVSSFQIDINSGDELP